MSDLLPVLAARGFGDCIPKEGFAGHAKRCFEMIPAHITRTERELSASGFRDVGKGPGSRAGESSSG